MGIRYSVCFYHLLHIVYSLKDLFAPVGPDGHNIGTASLGGASRPRWTRF